MNVVIIEDENLHYNRLERILKDLNPDVKIMAHISTVEEGLRYFENPSETIDLIFSDINLGDGVCFEIFDNLHITIPVIFNTAYDKYMLQAFKVLAIDYLLKPVNREELKKSLEKFNTLNRISAPKLQQLVRDLTRLSSADQVTYPERFLVKVGTKMLYIKTDDIAYFEAEDRILFIVTSEKKFLFDKKLYELESLVDPVKFCRVNRKYLVNINAVREIHNHVAGKIILKLHPPPPAEVVVNKETVVKVKKWMGDI